MTQQLRKKNSHILQRNPRENLLSPGDTDAKEDGRSTEVGTRTATSLFPIQCSSHSITLLPWEAMGSYPALKSNSYEVSPKLSQYLAAKENNSPPRIKGLCIKGLREDDRRKLKTKNNRFITEQYKTPTY